MCESHSKFSVVQREAVVMEMGSGFSLELNAK